MRQKLQQQAAAVAPAAPEPVRIPSPSDPDVLQTRRLKMFDEFASRRGRDSTDMSNPNTPYARTTLG